jgi:hypothetical protein
MTDRRNRILNGLDIESMEGVEIGALCWPIVRKDEGPITYVDCIDTPSLQKKYAAKPLVLPELMVDVDVALDGKTLAEAFVPARQFDYVLASHVVQHVPDLIGWLGELVPILKENGTIRLVVPDRRFTFDHCRRNTQLSDVMAAFVIEAKVPQPQQILDFLTNFRELTASDGWASRHPAENSRLSPENSAKWISKAIEATAGVHHDVHCWAFTPESFAILFYEMALARLHSFECHFFYDTLPDDYEFIVALKYNTDLTRILESWQAMAKAVTGEGSSSVLLKANGDLKDRASPELKEKIAILSSQLDLATNELARRKAPKD